MVLSGIDMLLEFGILHECGVVAALLVITLNILVVALFGLFPV